LRRITYQVIKEFDGTIQYDFQIYPRYRRCLSSFKKGQKFSPTEFIYQNINKFSPNEAGFEATENIVCSSIGIAKKLGLICEILSEPLSFKEFCKYETVQYCSSQLKGSSFKNLKPKQPQNCSTRGLYMYRLWHFNNWLIGKNFEFSKFVQTGIDTFQKQTISIKLEGLEHFLKLYQSSHQSDNKFARMIKEYLMDDSIHKGKKEGTIRITKSAIKSYFETNDSPIQFRFNVKATYQSTSEDDDLIKNYLQITKETTHIWNIIYELMQVQEKGEKYQELLDDYNKKFSSINKSIGSFAHKIVKQDITI